MTPEQLPSDARKKLEFLRQRSDERHALVNAAVASTRDCEARSVRLANLARNAGTDQARADYSEKLELCRDEHTRLVQLRTQRGADHRSAAHDYARLESWVARLSDTTRLRIVPKRLAVQYDAERLTAVRNDIAKIKSELQQVQGAPLSREEQQAIRAQQFDAALAGFYLEESPFRTKLCTRTGTLRELTLLEFEWWLRPADHKALLDKLVPEVAGTMTASEKRESTERLAARLLSAERAEESLVMAGEALGIFVERRRDVDELALLGLTIIANEPAAAVAA